MKKKEVSDFNDYVIIGLGKFGKSMALNLSRAGKKVLVVDTDASNVAEIESLVTNAVVADVTKAEVLHSLGVQNFDCAIICIGNDLTSSMLATEICKELEVPYIIAKAQSDKHKTLLEKIGADLVVFPEVYMSKRLVTALVDPFANEIIKLTDNYKIVEMKCPANWIGKSLQEVNVRKKYGVTIIFIKRESGVIEPLAESVFEQSDILVVAGTPNHIEDVESKITEFIDIRDIFQDATGDDE
jgi:trk system potassium uptake protein TrkA